MSSGADLAHTAALSLFAQEDAWDDDDWGDDAWSDDEAAVVWSGFAEAGIGTRFETDPLVASRNTLEELRWRLEAEWNPGKLALAFKGDAVWDGVSGNLEGDVRDLSAAFTLGQSLDVKVGRQVNTWGTGDMLFLNDLFPKDWVSFFAGRDDEYLKAPGNSIRLTRFSPAFNFDFVWSPQFEPDNYLTARRCRRCPRSNRTTPCRTGSLPCGCSETWKDENTPCMPTTDFSSNPMH